MLVLVFWLSFFLSSLMVFFFLELCCWSIVLRVFWCISWLRWLWWWLWLWWLCLWWCCSFLCSCSCSWRIRCLRWRLVWCIVSRRFCCIFCLWCLFFWGLCFWLVWCFIGLFWMVGCWCSSILLFGIFLFWGVRWFLCVRSGWYVRIVWRWLRMWLCCLSL